MISFDDVLPTLVRVCESFRDFQALARACVVRDLRGRVRLIVEPRPGGPALVLEDLQKEIRRELGDYFAQPIWSTEAPKEKGRVAKALLQQPGVEAWSPTYDDPVTGVKDVPARGTWCRFERRLSKDAWLDSSRSAPPWALGDGPPIATFYSFKGGVGRTTALVSCAWQLAKAGKRVVVLDLDLEAPGLGPLLGVDMGRGALDFLVDHVATGNILRDNLVRPATTLGEDGEKVRVVPAGHLGSSFLEKLARLDYATATQGPLEPGESPMELALRALLFAVRSERPDYILIDARAGLHDLGGISLHRLAHVDVLVTRASEQAYRGFDLTLNTLARRKGAADLSCVVVHAMAPLEGSPGAPFEEQEVRERVYASFREHVYRPPHTLDIDQPGPHQPSVLRYNPVLVTFNSLRAIEGFLVAADYKALHDRVVALLQPPGDST